MIFLNAMVLAMIFLLIVELTKDYRFTEDDSKSLAQVSCNREGLLGADGILFVLKSEKVDARMRGNGLCCVA